MPLVIHLKKGAQVIVNGAVLENVGNRTASIAIKNDAAILRGDDILAPDAAATPASRIYYALQCAYLFAERRDEHLSLFASLLSSYVRAAPSAEPVAGAVAAAAAAGNLYDALKKAQALLLHEGKVLTYVQERLVEELQHDTAAG